MMAAVPGRPVLGRSNHVTGLRADPNDRPVRSAVSATTWMYPPKVPTPTNTHMNL